MKVAILTDFPRDPDCPYGGVETVSVNLVKALASIPGLSLDVVTADEDMESVHLTEWCGVRIHRLPRQGKLLSYVTVRGRRSFGSMSPGSRPTSSMRMTIMGS